MGTLGHVSLNTVGQMSAYAGVSLVTCAWGCMAYVFMPWGPTANMTGQNEAQKKFGDRSFMNLLEQAPMFLTSLWLFAINCSATEATALGTAYLVLRALYPVMWLIKGGKNVGYPMPVGFFVTFPAYAVILTMYISVIAIAMLHAGGARSCHDGGNCLKPRHSSSSPPPHASRRR